MRHDDSMSQVKQQNFTPLKCFDDNTSNFTAVSEGNTTLNRLTCSDWEHNESVTRRQPPSYEAIT